METIKRYLPIIITLALVALVAVFVLFWWLKTLLILFIILTEISMEIIAQIKFNHKNLKKRFPKYAWHIQRLHDMYAKEKAIKKVKSN